MRLRCDVRLPAWLTGGFLGLDVGGNLSPPREYGRPGVEATAVDSQGHVVGGRRRGETALELLERHADEPVCHDPRILSALER